MTQHTQRRTTAMHTHITVKGARVNNLKNIDVTIPRDLTLIPI